MVSSLREKVMARTPKILVFDSGLGGLTVFRALLERRPDAQFLYAADDLGFPYGPKSEAEVSRLVLSAMERLIARPCARLRGRRLQHRLDPGPAASARPLAKIPFVGTVPAIKPAAEQSQSRLITILATPGTVARDYTRDLIDKFAGHCDVTLIGSQKLAALAEGFMQGQAISADAVAREIAPCFVERDGRRTDAIVLACTHYPLLLDFFTRLAPWPVHWINPAAAIARRADHVISDHFPKNGGREALASRSSSPAAPRPRKTLQRRWRLCAARKQIFQQGFNSLFRRRVIAACAAAIPARDLRRVDLAFEIGEPSKIEPAAPSDGHAIFDQRRVNLMRLAAGERFLLAAKSQIAAMDGNIDVADATGHRVGLHDDGLAFLENHIRMAVEIFCEHGFFGPAQQRRLQPDQRRQ